MISLEKAREWYPEGDAVHNFEHVERVYHLAEKLAAAEGADMEVVRAAALLHDVKGSTPGAERKNHHDAAANFAREVLLSEGWPIEKIEAVQDCIRAHRFRGGGNAPQTLEARALFDADKLDAIGAVGVARALAYAVQAGAPFFSEPSRQFLETGKEAPGEEHSAYHEYIFKLQKIQGRLFTRTARELAESRHHLMTNYFEQLAGEMRGER